MSSPVYKFTRVYFRTHLRGPCFFFLGSYISATSNILKPSQIREGFVNRITKHRSCKVDTQGIMNNLKNFRCPSYITIYTSSCPTSLKRNDSKTFPQFFGRSFPATSWWKLDASDVSTRSAPWSFDLCPLPPVGRDAARWRFQRSKSQLCILTEKKQVREGNHQIGCLLDITCLMS